MEVTRVQMKRVDIQLPLPSHISGEMMGKQPWEGHEFTWKVTAVKFICVQRARRERENKKIVCGGKKRK